MIDERDLHARFVFIESIFALLGHLIGLRKVSVLFSLSVTNIFL